MLNGDGVLTLEEFLTVFMWVCTTLITVSAAVTIIINIVKKLKEPENLQNEEIKEIRKELGDVKSRVGKCEERFDKSDDKIESFEEGQRITQQSLLALLSHAINGNDVGELKKAYSDLKKYLVDKKG